MRVLMIHSDYLEFETKKKAISVAEEPKEKSNRVENVLVVFIAVEKVDEKGPKSVADQLIETIVELYGKVGAKTIAIYPYAHLSSELGSPKVAQDVLDDVFTRLKDDYKTIKVPFGWYKSFELKCKGHPLSEASRTILPAGDTKGDEVESKAIKSEDKLKSSWFIMEPNGKLTELEKYSFKDNDNLKKLSKHETDKIRVAEREPPHVQMMRSLELVDYEPGSDPGNMRYYPKGKLIKGLLEEYVTERIHDYGALEVESPIMYDMEHPSLAEYVSRFPARQYILESEKKNYFLRFAACFGQFLMAHDAIISYRNLPLRLYELARYAFRKEKSGELTGLRRLRAFTMPDVHAMCADMDQAMDEYKRRLQLSLDVVEGIGFKRDDFELAIRVTRDFYEENKEFIQYLVKSFGRPALVEMWEKRIFYFVLKYELNFVDALEKASALSTDQIDVENGKRYDIEFIDKQGKQRNPIILHCSPSGAIERVIYALLEKAHFDKQVGIPPMLPMWLSPTQLRIVPVSEDFLGHANDLAEKITTQGIRVDIDDRNESLGKKIRDAEKEWIPLIAVVGEKEMKSGKLSVRIRENKSVVEMTMDDAVSDIKNKSQKKPYKPLPLPLLISKRPKFVG